ncbi:MAG: hypothetical protein M0R03_02015 [Novosphingobium sp.]|nr:hypothetical protein [Novosphingobium sp.]
MTNPNATPDQFAAERDVVAIRQDPRIDAARMHIEALFARGYGNRIPPESQPLLGAFCEEYLTNWLFKAAASDSQHPRFVRDFMPAYSWAGHDVPGARTGGDNPDNCYRLAGIKHGTAYRVHGKPAGKVAANISFTLTANYGTSQTVQTIEHHDLQLDADGGFVITIDDTPAEGRPNHMTTRPGTKFLFVRDSLMDWAAETELDLTIERVGDAKAEPVPLETMAARAAEHALNDLYLYFWFQNVWSGLAPNTITKPEAHRGQGGGLVTQGICNGSFDLGTDDAAILEYDPADAGYAAVQLTEWLYRSLDYHQRQSSLTAAQSAIDDDGLIRLVIARRDPGVANWLDTGGAQHAHMIMRWQKMRPEGRPIGANLRLTTIDRLKGELPVETVWVSPEERASRLAGRIASYRRRITV